MIDIEEKYSAEIHRILSEYISDCEVRVFDSRIKDKARDFSDLNLVLVGSEKIDWRRIELLKDAFASSNLPMTVDVIDWHAIPDEFRAIIEKNYEIIQDRK